MSAPRLLVVAAAVVLAGAGAVLARGEAATRAQPDPQVPRYGVFEGELPWQTSASNPWDQVTADVRLVSPARKEFRIGGFYAGSNLWKFRFAPAELGRWTWSATVSEGSRSGSFSGAFVAVRSAAPGFVRQSPYNRLRWTFQNGAPYYPIGLNNCTDVGSTPAELWGFDGGFRAPDAPHGPGSVVDMDTYMRAYSAAGFDLFRWGPDNCSFPLFDRIDPGGNLYSQRGGAIADRLVQTLRRFGFRVEFVLFGGNTPFVSDSDAANPAKMAADERYAKYIVDRYGAYVDFWELTNEADTSDRWISQLGAYVKRVDPYGHPLGTSWDRPGVQVLDFGSDHWYQTEKPTESDAVTWGRLHGEPARKLGKPVLVDEQGNAGMNWDPTSGLRLRIRSWTAFFAEGTLVFWNASFIKNCCPNGSYSVYIGPEERGYVRVLQSFTRGFDPRAAAAQARVTGPARAYALRGPRQYALYLVAGGGFDRPTRGVRVSVNPVRAGVATWIDPASGRVLARRKVKAGSQVLAVPRFTVDVALKITP
jgi:hypothetical protein